MADSGRDETYFLDLGRYYGYVTLFEDFSTSLHLVFCAWWLARIVVRSWHRSKTTMGMAQGEIQDIYYVDDDIMDFVH